MANNLVTKSFHRFLNENDTTGTFITYDSNFSSIKVIKNLYSQQTLDPTNTTDTLLTGDITSISGMTVIGNGTLFTSELNDGDSIKVNGTIAIINVVINDTEIDLKYDFTQEYEVGDSIYIPSGKEFVVITQEGTANASFTSDIDLDGWSLFINGEIIPIVSFDSDKSQILLGNNCSEMIQGYDYDTNYGDSFEVSLDKLMYLYSPYVLPPKGRIRCSIENTDKYVLKVKTKNDSKKIKINNILQNINETIISKYLTFPVYDTDDVTITTYADINEYSYKSTELYDNTVDLQSFMVEMHISYRTIYK